MARFDLISPFPPEECVDRLRAGMLNPHAEIDGLVRLTQIRLRKKSSLLGSFQAFLFARLEIDGPGTRIHGTVGVHPVTKFVWVLGLVLAGLGALTACVLTPLLGTPFSYLLIPFGVLAGLGFGGWVGRLLARGDEALLLDFVTTTLDAKALSEATVK